MSLSSFGNFRASGGTTLLTPDCSSALGLYVPSVCLFFFTTQRSQARTARTMTRTPRMTVGATIAATFGPYKWKNTGQGSAWWHWALSDIICWSWWKFFTHCAVIGVGGISKSSIHVIPCEKKKDIRCTVVTTWKEACVYCIPQIMGLLSVGHLFGLFINWQKS